MSDGSIDTLGDDEARSLGDGEREGFWDGLDDGFSDDSGGMATGGDESVDGS